MPIKRSLSEESEDDPRIIKDEPYIPDDEPLTPPRKKARKPTTPKSGSSAKSTGSGLGSPSGPRSVKCKVILALIDAGLKAVKRDSIAQGETGATPKQIKEWMRKDGKGALYIAVVGFSERL